MKHRMLGSLTVVVGLPGSGKSRLIAKLGSRATGLVADDFMNGVPFGSLVPRHPTVTDSKYYSTLIKDLRRGKSCVVSDIIFCDVLVRTELEAAVKADARGVQVSWQFFENNQRKCAANAHRRARKESLATELKLIKFLGRKYFVPEGIKAHAIWDAKKQIVKKSRRR